MNDEKPKLTPDDPALKAINRMTKVLAPFTREQQLRVIAAVCIQCGFYDDAEQILKVLREESKEAEHEEAEAIQG